ncbi:hypothetical protein DAI22_02g039950 [Oryza sativa Japonica Group]|nr:hypothetical protein DAI22_02g039950 [Oryza sativa Japonica Group]
MPFPFLSLASFSLFSFYHLLLLLNLNPPNLSPPTKTNSKPRGGEREKGEDRRRTPRLHCGLRRRRRGCRHLAL